MSSPADAPRVSIFVQAYNSAAFIAECLTSVLNQRSRYSFNVLVVDDASTDGTAEAIARFSDPRLRTIRHDRNVGAIATANEGYALSEGQFIVRLDSDDRLHPQFLERTVPIFDAHPRVGLVYGDVVTIDAAGKATSVGGVVRRGGRPHLGNEFFPLLLDNFIPAPATMVRREALRPLLPIPASYRFLDWYLTTGITETWDSCFVDEVIADYRIHDDNMHRAMILDRRGEQTSRAVLDALFSSRVRGDEKRVWRRRVYARHFLTYADKYFGVRMAEDARRCYLNAIRLEPKSLFTTGVLRRLGATFVGQSLYDAAKERFAPRRAL